MGKKNGILDWFFEPRVDSFLDSENRKFHRTLRIGSLRGILHAKNVQKVHVNGTAIHNQLSMKYQDGEILHLKIEDNKVFLLVEWKNFPPKGPANDVSRIKIEPIEITWESISFFEANKD